MRVTRPHKMADQDTTRLGAAPATLGRAVICLSPQVGWSGSLVTADQREVSPLAWPRLQRGIRPITGRRSLPPSSFTRRPVGSPYGGPTLTGGRRADHVASQESSWVRPRLDAGGTPSAPDEFAASGPGHLPFWSKPLSTFGLSLFTTLAAVHLGWPYHAPLVPDRRGAGSRDLGSRSDRPPRG